MLAQPRRKGLLMLKALLAGIATVLVSFSLVATASAATGLQTFDFFGSGPPGTPRTVAASGPISGVGTVVIGSDVAGPGGTRIATTTWGFREGSVFVTLTYTFQPSFDPHTCMESSYLTGTWRITGATGRYAGATGSGTFSGPNSVYYRRTASGCSSNAYLHVTRFRFWGIATVI